MLTVSQASRTRGARQTRARRAMVGPKTRAEHRIEAKVNTKDQRLRASVEAAIDAGGVAESFRSNQGRFLQIGNRRIRLQNGDGTLTPAGHRYHEHLGEEPPLLYSYEQPLEQNKWVRGSTEEEYKFERRSMELGW